MLKRLLLKLFVKDKYIGKASAIGASALASWLASFIPGAPELLLAVARSLMDLPPGTEITSAGITVVLTPVIYSLLTTITQEYLVNDNNKVLGDLQATGKYLGPKDGHVGPVAREAISEIVVENQTVLGPISHPNKPS